jgi:hypothetical protein
MTGKYINCSDNLMENDTATNLGILGMRCQMTLHYKFTEGSLGPPCIIDWLLQLWFADLIK